MRVCGVELKSNFAIVSVLEFENDDIVDYIDLKIKKITLEDDEDCNSVKEFLNQFNQFLEGNKISKVFVKKRSKKGAFSGGAISFKMEGVIQLNSICNIELLSAQTISSYEKKNNIEYPSKLTKYQKQSYLTALASF